jgi:ATP-dependent Lon protease
VVDYLEWLAELPWNVSKPDAISIRAARAQLEADHFGMEKVVDP